MMGNNSDNNEVLSAVILLQRIIPRLHGNTRETIKRNQLQQISQSVVIVLRSLEPYCKEPLVLTPLMEIINLIQTVCADETFVETDSETKSLLVDRAEDAFDYLCLFAGKFYIEHTFTWSFSKSDVLREVVDKCLAKGFYFGYDKILREEGAI